MLPPDVTAWVLTDGKAGDEIPCIGVAEALGLTPVIRRVKPRAPWFWLAPWGPIDPAEAPDRPGSPIAPPFPDLVIGTGRRAIPYVKRVKKGSGGRTFTVILKDPRAGAGAADFIWVPEHDRLRAANVMTTLTSPHRISQAKLAAARVAPPAFIEALPPPRAAVLVGGDSRHLRFSDADVASLTERLSMLAAGGASLMGTLSRRTPPKLADAMRKLFAEHQGWLWDGTGDNPLIPLLALADAVVVTADSANMPGEAAATGKPVLVFSPGGRGHPKHRAFLAGLAAQGVVHNFSGRLEGRPYPPLDSTPAIAQAIAERFRAFRNLP
ncbi:mitochondrial fission ELM1 family protein [Terrarubrum flagellatum]|uniref:mitochondrial fission ELM1 family protein n=1 Tax=Terrirubrum flagellatum TaxID=2895980 RepID=UPI00314553DE